MQHFFVQKVRTERKLNQKTKFFFYDRNNQGKFTSTIINGRKTQTFRNNHLPPSNRMFKHRCLKSVEQWLLSNEWIQSSANVTISMKIHNCF